MMEKGFNYSLQSYLFDLLKTEQQYFVAEYLGRLNKKKQRVLCAHLLDFIEFGEFNVPQDPKLAQMFLILTGNTEQMNNDRRVIRTMCWKY